MKTAQDSHYLLRTFIVGSQNSVVVKIPNRSDLTCTALAPSSPIRHVAKTTERRKTRPFSVTEQTRLIEYGLAHVSISAQQLCKTRYC